MTFNELTDQRRENRHLVYAMWKTDGLTYKEIGRRLDLHASTVAHHVHKAREDLREALRTRPLLLAYLGAIAEEE